MTGEPPPCLRCEEPAVYSVVLAIAPVSYRARKGDRVALCGDCTAQAMALRYTLSITDGLAVWPAPELPSTPVAEWLEDPCSQKTPTPKSEPTSTASPRSSKGTPARRATRSRATTASSPRRKPRRTPASSDSPTSQTDGRNRSHPNPG